MLTNKFLIGYLLVVFLGFISLLLGEWWSLLLVATGVGLMLRAVHPSVVGLLCALAGITLYGFSALYFGSGGGRLPGMIGELFKLGNSATAVLAVTAIVGGISTGLFGALGAYLRVVLQGRPT